MFNTIALNKLTKSPKNVRKVTPSKSAFAELKASIEDQGLLQNLVVEASSSGEGCFEVIAGGRRLEVLQALYAEGKLPEDYGVACRISNDNQTAISLAENIVREAMSPADQFQAWSRLIDEGETTSSIARRFGVEEALIRRRLKLGRLAPEILDGFREDKINLERLMALTLSDDHAQQLAIYERIIEQPHSFHPHDIRKIITEDRVSTKTRVGAFVGVEAYEAAGGSVLRDLFEEDTAYFEDPALLTKLAEEKLADCAAKLLTEGWKWTDVIQETSYGFCNEFDRIYPHPINVPAEITEELTKLEGREEELNDLDNEDWTEELEAEAETLQKRSQELNDIIESHKGFSAEEKARSGCIVSIDYHGDIDITGGLVLPEDQDPDAVATENAVTDGETETSEEVSGFKLGKQLIVDLTAHRLQIAKSYLISDFDLTFDLAVFSLCLKVFRSNYYAVSKPLSLILGMTEEISSRDDLEDTPASERRAAIYKTFDLSWLNEDTAFETLCAFPLKEKQRLFAFCIAQGLYGQLAQTKHADPVLEAIGVRLGIDMVVDWRPTADNFWGRITKAHALSLSSDVLGAQWALSHSKDKKSVLSPRLEQIFSGETSAGLPAQVQEAARQWVPDFMAYAEVADAGIDEDVTTSSPETVGEGAVEAEPVSEDIISELETQTAEDAQQEDMQAEDTSSESFLKDHIQIIHVGDKPSGDTDPVATNGHDGPADVMDETLPAFLQETG